jgi:hypothetical protein
LKIYRKNLKATMGSRRGFAKRQRGLTEIVGGGYKVERENRKYESKFMKFGLIPLF